MRGSCQGHDRRSAERGRPPRGDPQGGDRGGAAARAPSTAGPTGRWPHAVEDAGVDPGLSRLAFPRGGVDLALAFHYERDAALAEDLAAADLLGLRFRDRIAHAVMRRLELVADDREAVRRGVALFALPHHAADGARAIWHTADTIWTALGDDEPRLQLVHQAHHALGGLFLGAALLARRRDRPASRRPASSSARRIDNVMQIEEVKARIAREPDRRGDAEGAAGDP